MKKSHGVTLTVVAAVAMATTQGQSPEPQAASPGASQLPDPCATAIQGSQNASIPANCFWAAHNGFATARVAGFGATARRRHAAS